MDTKKCDESSDLVVYSGVPRSTRYRILGSVVLLLLGCLATMFLGAGPASAAPSSARSYYIYNYDLNWAYNRGCDAGAADASTPGAQHRYVVFDFGSMHKSSSGTWMFSAFSHPDISSPHARYMINHWAQGYWTCVGADVSSVAHIAFGTNNSAGDITSAAGHHLATLAHNSATDLQSPTNFYSQARPVGGNDFEAFSGPSSLNSKSRAWINGYNSNSNRPFFVNYGSADGCPQGSVPSPSSCNAPLNAETIYQVSWSGAAYPLPEIYTNSGSQAKQWRYLSKYGHNYHGSSFVFKGVMAQSGACSQTGGCSGTDNTPSQAWNQLNGQVNTDPITATTPGAPTNIWQGPTS